MQSFGHTSVFEADGTAFLCYLINVHVAGNGDLNLLLSLLLTSADALVSGANILMNKTNNGMPEIKRRAMIWLQRRRMI